MDRHIRLAIASTVAVGALFMSTCAGDPGSLVAADLAITNVTVIDATSGAREHHTVLVAEDRITAVIPAPGAIFEADNEIDGTGKFLIPGLWDMHVHVTYEPDLTDSMAALFLSYGITSVRDTGGLVDLVSPVVQQWRKPGAVAPRIFWAGPLLDGAKVVYDGQGRPEIGLSNATPETAQANIASLKTAGVDFVKIYELVTPEVFSALVAAARDAELPIDSHVPLSMTADTAGPLVDSMEHLRNVELACASNADELLAQRRLRISSTDESSGYALRSVLHAEQRSQALRQIDNARCDAVVNSLTTTIQVPTLRLNTFAKYPAFDVEDWRVHLARMPEPLRTAWGEVAQQAATSTSPANLSNANWSLDLVGRLHQAGVPIGAGTDTPIGLAIPGYSLHRELELLVEAGLSELEAIASATVQPAEFFGLETGMGEIATGHAADLLLLNADPLADIRNSRDISTVISKGKVVRARQQ